MAERKSEDRKSEEEKCSNCENFPNWHCEQCNQRFCTTCKDSTHKFHHFRTHIFVQSQDLVEFKSILESDASGDHESANDITSIDNAGNIILTRAFYRIISELEENAQPSFISVLGNTGTGKSTLLKCLFSFSNTFDKPMPFPVTGTLNGISCTSDLYLYGPLKSGDEINPYDLLFLDTEGLKGSSVPDSLLNRLGRANDILKNVVWKKRRAEHIQSSYPKLAYITSDVVCYLCDHSWKEKAFLIELIDWANQGSAAVVNQGIKPKLFIIFNKINPADFSSVPYYDSNALTEEYFRTEPTLKSQLELFFSNPTVVFIPHKSINLVGMMNSVKSLHSNILSNLKEIRTLRARHLRLLSTSNVRRLFSHAVDCLNTVPQKEINLQNVINVFNSDHHENCFVLFFQELLNAKIPIQRAITILREKLYISALLYLDFQGHHFNQIEGVRQFIETNWIPLSRRVEEKCDREFVSCNAQSVFQCEKRNTRIPVKCGCTSGFHPPDSHESTDVVYKKRTWVGFFAGEPYFIPYACRWRSDSGFLSPGIPFNLAEFMNTKFQENSTLSRDMMVIMYAENLRLEDTKSLYNSKPSNKFCLGCIFGKYPERLECGHYFCNNCCSLMKKYYSGSCLCCNRKIYWSDDKLAGYRILSLDGGGVRGIVEILILSKIEEILGLFITDLFDLIVGTSTGAIVGSLLCCSELKSASEGLNLISQATEAAFGSQYVTFDFLKYWYGYKYLPNNLLNFLKFHFQDRSIITGANKRVKLAITSCLTSFALPTVLFTTYSRPIEEGNNDPTKDLQPMESFSIVDAVRASSAAGTCFPPHQVNGFEFTDGGMRNNNPSFIAVQEASRIWGKSKKCDVLINIGTGYFEGSNNSQNILQFVDNIVNVVSDSQQSWDDAKFACGALPMYRLNPNLQQEIPLDDWKNSEPLHRYTHLYLQDPKTILVMNEVCLKLLASLFFLEIVSNLGGKIALHIVCRIRLPPQTKDYFFIEGFELKDGLGETVVPFNYNEETGCCAYLELTRRTDEKLELSCFANVRLRDQVKIESVLISGMPLRL